MWTGSHWLLVNVATLSGIISKILSTAFFFQNSLFAAYGVTRYMTLRWLPRDRISWHTQCLPIVESPLMCPNILMNLYYDCMTTCKYNVKSVQLESNKSRNSNYSSIYRVSIELALPVEVINVRGMIEALYGLSQGKERPQTVGMVLKHNYLLHQLIPQTDATRLTRPADRFPRYLWVVTTMSTIIQPQDRLDRMYIYVYIFRAVCTGKRWPNKNTIIVAV